MITMQGLLVLIAAILGAAIAAGLTLAAAGTWPAALLAGGSAALAVAGLLVRLLSDGEKDS
jgi:hypothetical protein